MKVISQLEMSLGLSCKFGVVLKIDGNLSLGSDGRRVPVQIQALQFYYFYFFNNPLLVFSLKNSTQSLLKPPFCILLTTVMQTHHKSSSKNQGFCEHQA